jgi:hypothetical protein
MPADFNFTIDDLTDSSRTASKIGESYNPNGTQSLVTSASKGGYEDVSLTTRDVTEIMSRRCTY